MLRDELTKDLPGIKLPMTLSFDYPSVQALKTHKAIKEERHKKH